MEFRGLPCGGSITTGDDGEIIRIIRHIGAGERQVAFVLAHPRRLNKGEEDLQSNLCLAFARSRGFDVAKILYLLPYPAREVKELKRKEFPVGRGPSNRRIQDMEVRWTANSRHGGLVIAAWGEAGRFADADTAFMRRHDGTPLCLSSLRCAVTQVYALGFTESGAPAPLSPTNIAADLMPLFSPHKPKPRKAAA